MDGWTGGWTDRRTKEEQTVAQSSPHTEEVESKLQPRSLESSGDARCQVGLRKQDRNTGQSDL